MRGALIPVVTVALVMGVMSGVPNQAVSAGVDVYELAAASPRRVLFSEDFEGPSPQNFEQWYAGHELFTVKDCRLTDEVAHSGSHCFKLTFYASKGGTTYFWIPVRIPRWSQLTVTMYVKTDPPGVKYQAGVGWAHPTGGYGGNVLLGAEVETESEGWEKWQLRLVPTLDPGDYLQGLAIFCYLPEDQAVTYYIDDITVAGRLPDNYADLHAEIKENIDTQREQQTHQLYARRLNDLANRLNRLRMRFAAAGAPQHLDSYVAQQWAKVGEQIEAEFERLVPPVNQQLQQYRETGEIDQRQINPLERDLGPLGLYVDSYSQFGRYVSRYGTDDPYVLYVVEPTQSYAILPGGPQGHKEESSYYQWGGHGGLENPQILPDTSPIPGVPSRRLEAFGCRGQYVPLSFVVQTAKALPELQFEVSPLSDGKALLPAEVVDLRVVKAWWRPFPAKGGDWTPRFMNELLVHDDQFVEASSDKPVNHFKDAKYATDTSQLTPVTIPAGQARQFWITVHVPTNAHGGTYTGTITGSSAQGQRFKLSLTVTVLTFELEPTPFAYSFFYRSYLRSAEEKQKQGVHSWYKTAEQMRREFIDMAQHGLNTLCTYDGNITKTEEGWDFSRLKLVLDMATKAGLTRSPFVWLGHPLYFRPYPDRDPKSYPQTSEEVVQRINQVVPAVSQFLADNGYPAAAYFGEDERAGEELIRLKPGYQAVNDAGGIVTVACGSNYFSEIGTALSLPIVYAGAQGAAGPLDDVGERSIRASQKAGYECWIYNHPCTDQAASPAVYRRRYGLALWRNGEDGAIPWEYSGHGRDLQPYMKEPQGRMYAVAYPTWEGPPIDTIIYEAFREGIYDTRYLATLLKYRDMAEKEGKAQALVKRVNQWLESFSVNDDLQQVRWQMVQWIQRLRVALGN